jgi:exonuclease 3'-5' domain-containing protein 1
MSTSSQNITAEFITTPGGIKTFVDHIAAQEADAQPVLYIDLEGQRLSRNGTISLLTVLTAPGTVHQRFSVIDIHTLRHSAFATLGSRGKSLKDILESPSILKVFFDVRNDSDALHHHYGIRLQGVRDVQLMENANRTTTYSRKFISGLSKCIEGVLTEQEKIQWKRVKDTGERFWNPEKGGSYGVFNQRPLSAEVLAYCVGDVQYLPRLYQNSRKGIGSWQSFTALIAQASQDRVSASQQSGYLPQGPNRALSPWTVEQNCTLDSWVEQFNENLLDEVYGSGAYEETEIDRMNDELLCDYFNRDDDELCGHDEDYDDRCDNDYEDWTRADWQGPPS